MRALAPVSLIALMAVSSACEGLSEIVLVIESDLAAPEEIDELDLVVDGPTSSSFRGMQPLARGDLPHTFGLRAGGDSLGPMTITASAFHTGTLVVTRTVRTSFVRDTSRMLVVRLVRACAAHPACDDEGWTCGEGGECTPPDVASDTLAPWPGAAPAPALGAALPPPIAASSGSERCVAPTGLDTALGTCDNPWLTVEYALTHALPGDTILLREGTYAPMTGNVVVLGTPDAPITVRPFEGERAVVGSVLLQRGSAWVRIQRLVADGDLGATGSLIEVDSGGGVLSHDIEISDNEVLRGPTRGIFALGEGHRVIHNRVHHNGTSGSNGAIQIDGARALVAGNLVHDNASIGIELYTEADDAIVAGNTIVANGGAGVVIGGTASVASDRVLIVNNIIASNASGASVYWSADLAGAYNRARNNLAFDNDLGTTLMPGLLVDATLSADRATVFVELGPPGPSPVGTPRDLQLAPGSAAIDVALAEWSLPTDLDGRTRPTGAGVDLGCYESP